MTDQTRAERIKRIRDECAREAEESTQRRTVAKMILGHSTVEGKGAKP